MLNFTHPRPKNILKITGAFIAWVIGSGFATGQEVLQFFSSYGIRSYWIVLIDLIGFVLFGYLLMRFGYENREREGFDHFRYYCGDKPGAAYSWLVFGTLLLMIPVLISGGGATFHEYYHLPNALGCAIMTGAVLAAYLIGFEKMVSLISKLTPVIVFFCLSVGLISLLQNIRSFPQIPSYEDTLAPYRAAPDFRLSAFLYLGLNFFPGSTYFTQLGTSASSVKEVKISAVCGGVLLILSVTVMSTAIMLGGNTAAGLDIPVLYLARKSSGVLGAVFSVMLLLGIFSSCSVMMWTVCSRLRKKTGKNAVTAVAVAAFGYAVSLFSFSDLIGTLYPIIGYAGLLYLLCVLWKGKSLIKRKNK